MMASGELCPRFGRDPTSVMLRPVCEKKAVASVEWLVARKFAVDIDYDGGRRR